MNYLDCTACTFTGYVSDARCPDCATVAYWVTDSA